MRALSLTQPWATLVALGAKQFETRSWRTYYRGPLAIHASKKYPYDCRLWSEEEPLVMAALDAAGVLPQFLPRGEIIGIVQFTDCTLVSDPMVREYLDAHPAERVFGDFSDDRFAWRLQNVVRLTTPIPAKGNLSLWDVEPEAVALINAQISSTPATE